jgi:starch synthase
MAQRPLRLLTVSHFYEEHGGGIERVAAQICREFASDGHHAVWAASDADPPPNGLMIEAIPLPCANPTEARIGLPMPIPGLRALRELSCAIRDCDAVVVHDALYLTSVFAMLIAKLRRKPVVLIQHIAGINFANAVLRGLMRIANCLVTRPMLRAADRLVFISDHVRRQLLGDPPRRDFTLLFNGVDTAIFDKRNSSENVRVAFGLPIDGRIALFVGRFVAKKGMTVLEAIARQRTDLSFVLVGSGPVRPEKWDLPNVTVLDTQAQQTIAELYSASDLLLLPSVGEGFPLVIQEAMACGLPVVCGEESALADPNATRWLRGVKIDLSDPDRSARACSAAIDSVFDDPPNRVAMAGYAAKTYNWSAVAAAIVQSLPRCAERVDRAARHYQPG